LEAAWRFYIQHVATRVLVVDDDPTVSNVVSAYRTGYRFLGAGE
jgi:hypothetical protein